MNTSIDIQHLCDLAHKAFNALYIFYLQTEKFYIILHLIMFVVLLFFKRRTS